ncbi:MAG: alpha/beta hydrolase [Armatimonadota bacterium]|nr:alpha/beta hydrolase [Armatimonadota bacterium]
MRRMAKYWYLVGIFILGIAASALEKPTKLSIEFNDVVYAKIGERVLHMDIAVPEDGTGKPHPTVVWIHGGGWKTGTYKMNMARWLTDHGYVVASIEYRLSGEAKFPAQITDCKAAIRFLRANSRKYGIDANRIGVWGGSAGGHLAALLGTTHGIKELEGDYGNVGISSRVQAVCVFYGPCDLTLPIARDPAKKKPGPVAELLGGQLSEKPELAKLASPIFFVTRDDPPFLLVHGEQDPLVPIEQAEKMTDALKKAGADVTFIRVKNAGHGFDKQGIEPSWSEIMTSVREFFDRCLRNK